MTAKEDMDALSTKIDRIVQLNQSRVPKWLIPVVLFAITGLGSLMATYIFMTKPEAKETHDEIVEILSEKIAEQGSHKHPVQLEINKSIDRKVNAQEKKIDAIEYNIIVIGEKVGAGRRLRRDTDGE